jgi:hypothetical protein
MFINHVLFLCDYFHILELCSGLDRWKMNLKNERKKTLQHTPGSLLIWNCMPRELYYEASFFQFEVLYNDINMF